MGITENEIRNQPALWLEIVDTLIKQRQSLAQFLSQALQPETEIILCGAGSSAFVGEMAAGILQPLMGHRCRAVATTDLLTHAELWIDPSRPLLLISFARSGNSPESTATVERVRQLHPSAFHFVITCNPQGSLAQMASRQGRQYHCLTLPESANDKGLAMIGSVTGMFLASIGLARLDDLSNVASEIQRLSELTAQFLRTGDKKIRDLSLYPFERAICLGSGPLLGVAREAHLKIQELSDGKVTGHFDSFLGFRHGPKALIQDRTLVLYFLSSDPLVMPYERDLVQSISREHPEAQTLGISELQIPLNVHDRVCFGERLGSFAPMALLLPAQLLGLFKSENLGLNPDSPSARGAIHRVVQGVTIYPFPGSLET